MKRELPSKRLGNLAKIAEGSLPSDLVFSDLDLACLAFIRGDKQRVQKRMEDARQNMLPESRFQFPYSSARHEIILAWHAAIRAYEIEAEFYITQEIEVKPLDIHEDDRIVFERGYPLPDLVGV